jgi:hypothetical protein
MDCPRCRGRNPEDARFCEVCGAALARPCPGCGLARSGRAGEAHALLAPLYARSTDGFELRDLVEANATLDALRAAAAQ